MAIHFLFSPLQKAQLTMYADQLYAMDKSPVEFILAVVIRAAYMKVDVTADDESELRNDEQTALQLMRQLGFAEFNNKIIKLNQ